MAQESVKAKTMKKKGRSKVVETKEKMKSEEKT